LSGAAIIPLSPPDAQMPLTYGFDKAHAFRFRLANRWASHPCRIRSSLQAPRAG
jgi:hypothetical protein